MKTVISVLILGLFAPSVFAFGIDRGGLSGGGGNVISAQPPTSSQNPHRIASIISQESTRLPDYLRQKNEQLNAGSLPGDLASAYSALFSAHPNIFDKVRQIPLHIESLHSCRDAANNPVDGSFLDDEAGTVCISAFAIAQKVREPEVRAQALALMVHEYAEVTGASEDQAVLLQKSVLTDLAEY